MSTDEPVNILLVDDEPAKLLSYEVVLRDLGANLITAKSGKEALSYLLKAPVAVMLVDVVMPDMDGFELAAMIREHPRYQKTAIIFVSAVSVTELDRLKGYQHGAVDYIPVPVVPDLLRAKVQVFVELYRKTRELEQLNAELERRVAERTAALTDANALLERRVEQRTREREAALAQLHEMQKMDSLGQLTGGLAHDFNNLLMGIIGTLDYLSNKLPDDPKAASYVTAAKESAERGAALTRRLLAFARRQELRPESVDVAELMRNMSDILQRTLGPTIQIDLHFEDELPNVRIDRNQLELAILNLALNSRDAMPNGGRLTIGARSSGPWPNFPSLQGNDFVVISVTDSGSGMDDATLRRCTEPFFTTKQVGKGTGLGLSAVHGLAAQSNGAMRISSELGHGTTVELLLPIAATEARSTVSTIEILPPPSQRYSVLVVDDEPLVGLLTASMVEELGHSAVLANSGRHALDVLNSGENVDIVITDLGMPLMNGAELAEHVSALRPDLPVVLATGYTDIPSGRAESLLRLSKPYSTKELATVFSMLARQNLSP